MNLFGTKKAICEIPDIGFGKIIFSEAEGEECSVVSVEEVTEKCFDVYLQSVKNIGYKDSSKQCMNENRFYVLVKDNTTLYISYYPTVQQMRVVGEGGTAYPDFKDTAMGANVQPLLTHIDLIGYGLSYVIRLSDGRFIIFDGGWEKFEKDIDKLMQVMREQSPYTTPRIAAWIFTHPHVDHYRCFLGFYPKYKDSVEIERLIYNFPNFEEKFEERYPDQISWKEDVHVKRFEALVKESKIPVLRAHTGQVYNISDARLEVLSTTDDTLLYPMEDTNALSLMIKVYIAGQSILFCADGDFRKALFVERYGNYLKSDILQIPHHGFCGGTAEGYRAIYPDVCLLPCEATLFYSDIYMADNDTLIYDLDVKEILTGQYGNHVLPLPYTAKPNGRHIMFERLNEVQNSMGSKIWYFEDMTWDECKFNVLNTTFWDIDVSAVLYFEDKADRITGIKMTANGNCITKIDFNNLKDIGMSTNPFEEKGIDKSKKFTVRFKSKSSVVISCGKPPVYVG